MTRAFLFLFFFILSVPAFAQKKAAPGVANLQCEYRQNPLGVEDKAPHLSWELTSPAQGVTQTAYRLLVADSPDALNSNSSKVWDSGKIKSGQSIQVAYAGPALQPAKHYYWKVMVWDNKNKASDWSEPAFWQMGLPTEQDWNGARWIAFEELPASERIVPAAHGKGPSNLGPGKNTLPLLRKEFAVQRPLKQATLFISGLGHFEASLNGQKIGDHFLDPGWTDYEAHALYVTFDVTKQLAQGPNALGVMLGNGFYHIPRERYRKLTGSFGYPTMICRLVLEYQDGTTANLVSDASWKTAPSPITFSSIYGGENYDATLEQVNWNRPGFSDASWQPVVLVSGPPALDAQLATPIKVFENFTPIKITQPKPGVWVYDLGQNASGIPQLTVKGARGTSIKITPGELMDDAGLVTQKATGSPYYFEYTLKGQGSETWSPRFTYYGYRYLQVEGGTPQGEANPQNLPVVESLKGLHTRNAVPRIGQFTSSNELFNKTEKLIDWAIRSNTVSVFTDCPHREKLGWLEQAHLVGASIRYSYDIASLSRKIVRDMQVAQTDKGMIPSIAPEYVEFNFNGDESFRDSPEWGSNGIIMPWYLYQWYGDREVLEESYPMMQKYIAYLQSKSTDHLLSHGLGDWYDLGPERPGFSQLTPKGVTATAIYYYDLGIMSQIAQLLGKPEEVRQYEQLAAQVKAAFNKAFFNPATKQYATGSQTANAMAVYMKLVEPQHKDAVVANIIQDIRNRNNSLTAGDIGYRYLLRVLDDAGRSDVIYDMNSRSDVPGYGYQLAQGATALTESWQALPVVSNNHFMLGHILEWFYSGLGGIRQTAGSVAFKAIDIRPEVVGDITSAGAAHQSPYGLIRTEWQKTDGTFALTVDIPANTTATVYLPATASAQLLEGGKPLKRNKAVKAAGHQDGRALVQVGSGTYRFEVRERGE